MPKNRVGEVTAQLMARLAKATNLLVIKVIQTHCTGLSARLCKALCCSAQAAAPGLEGGKSPHHTALEKVHLWQEDGHSLIGLRAGGTRVPVIWFPPGLQAPVDSVVMPAAELGPQVLCTGAWPPSEWHSTAAAGASREGKQLSGVLEPLLVFPLGAPTPMNREVTCIKGLCGLLDSFFQVLVLPTLVLLRICPSCLCFTLVQGQPHLSRTLLPHPYPALPPGLLSWAVLSATHFHLAAQLWTRIGKHN